MTPEISAAVWLIDDVLLGAEHRAKPNDLSAFRENGAEDVFIAWAPVKNSRSPWHGSTSDRLPASRLNAGRMSPCGLVIDGKLRVRLDARETNRVQRRGLHHVKIPV